MKLLLDFLPIILFFAVFKWGEGHKELAGQWLTQHLGFMVAGGVVGPKEAPMLLATVAVVGISVLQIAVMKLLRQKIDKMLWVSLVTVVGLGALTVYFHNPDFIKWKPTVIYWAMGGGLLVSDLIMKRYVLRTMMSASDIDLPDAIWRNLSWAWVLFFLGMGVLNLYVAYTYDESIWVNFKMWGGIGLMLVFTLAQGVYLARHMPPAKAKDAEAGPGVSR